MLTIELDASDIAAIRNRTREQLINVLSNFVEADLCVLNHAQLVTLGCNFWERGLINLSVILDS